MNCDKFHDNLYDYVEGLLDTDALHEFEEYCRQCSDCENEVKQLKDLNVRLKEVVPQLWHNIKPSPAFLAWLKSLDFEPEPGRLSVMADNLLLLRQGHRKVLVAGLSACLIIAMAVTIPFDKIGENEVVKEVPVEKVAEQDSALAAPVERSVEGEVVAEVPSTAKLEAMKAPPLADAGSGKELSVAPSPYITDLTAEQSQLVSEIAFTDSEVQEVLSDKAYRVTEIRATVPDNAPLSCAGPVSIVSIEPTAEFESILLYICVNTKQQLVESSELSITKTTASP
jgi:anti-sigma factor RsiW